MCVKKQEILSVEILSHTFLKKKIRENNVFTEELI